MAAAGAAVASAGAPALVFVLSRNTSSKSNQKHCEAMSAFLATACGRGDLKEEDKDDLENMQEQFSRLGDKMKKRGLVKRIICAEKDDQAVRSLTARLEALSLVAQLPPKEEVPTSPEEDAALATLVRQDDPATISASDHAVGADKDDIRQFLDMVKRANDNEQGSGRHLYQNYQSNIGAQGDHIQITSQTF